MNGLLYELYLMKMYRKWNKRSVLIAKIHINLFENDEHDKL